ncbi:MAG: hypothetical protein K8L91_18620 [Anaerolineae bacterium]|nr:hypothetical protein [Anaerolineae bacterium]
MFRFARLLAFLLVLVFFVMGIVAATKPLAHAQSGELGLALTAEDNIGFDCPISVAIDPSGTAWVLMDNCFEDDFTLLTFGAGGGEATNDEAHNFSSVLTALAEGTNGSGGMTDLSFAPDGTFIIHYMDANFSPMTMTIPAGSDGSSSTEATSSDANAVILMDYTPFPEGAAYNADGTQAVAINEDSLHVVDLQSGTEIVALDIPGGNFNAMPQFSADGTQLYVTQLNNINDGTAMTSTLHVYDLPGGELVASYDLPSFLAWVSPNGEMVAMALPNHDNTQEDLFVLELATGNLSNIMEVFEEPHQVTTCLNNGDDVSDLDYMSSGHLPINDLAWLPDSSGFVTVNSHFGEAAGNATYTCNLQYSRLRHYAVTSN